MNQSTPRYSVPRGGYAIKHLWKYNDYRVEGDIAVVLLRNRAGEQTGEVIIDKDDLQEVLEAAHWVLQSYPDKRMAYAHGVARGKGVPGVRRQPSLFLHRVIMKPISPLVVDHLDGNGLNCRRSNMRVVTRKENTYNTWWKRSMACTECHICSLHKTPFSLI